MSAKATWKAHGEQLAEVAEPDAATIVVEATASVLGSGADCDNDGGWLWCCNGFMWARRFSVFRLSKYGMGIALIVLVAVIWVASSVWIQYIFHELDFNRPFFLTYFNTTGFCFWNLGYLSNKWRSTPWEDEHETLAPDPGEDYKSGGEDQTSDSNANAVEPSPLGLEVTLSPSTVALGANAPDGDTASCTSSREMNVTEDPTMQLIPFSGLTPPPVLHERCIILQRQRRDEDELNEGQHDVTRRADLTKGVSYGTETNAAPSAAGTELCTIELTRRRCTRYGRKRIFTAALAFCPLWFFANCFFNVSLSITSVASNTILSATSTIWTLVLSHIALNYSVTFLKLTAVTACVIGTAMVALSDHTGDRISRNSTSSETVSATVSLSHTSSGGEGDSRGGAGRSTVVGDIIALLSAFLYASYSTILKWSLPDDDCFSMGMVFGAVGFLNFILLWPGLLVVHASGLEPFFLPSLGQFLPLLVNALIGTNLSDVLWARSVVLTSPVVATLGLSLTTPLAMIFDAVLKGSTYSLMYVTGAFLVMAGFIVANINVPNI